MVVPVVHHAAEQAGAAQEGAVVGRWSSNDQVVAAPGAGVLAVEEKLFGSQAGFAGEVVQRRGVGDSFIPALGGLDVHLDHPRARGDFRPGCGMAPF